MTTRTDVVVDWTVSPRIIEIDKASAEMTVQDLVDTLRPIESSFRAMSETHLIDAAGKEDLGGGVKVGITASLQDAQLSFEAREIALETGTVTTGDALGITLIDSDSSSNFLTSVARGDLIYNLTDQSVCSIISVTDDKTIVTDGLKGGSDNQFDSADVYAIYDVEQCSVSGGNLVAVDTVGDPINSIFTTFGTQIVRTSSSSATLQELTAIQFSSFGGHVSIDILNGIAGTAFPIGTHEQPVNNISDAFSIAATRGLSAFFIRGDITFDTGHDLTDFDVLGESPIRTTITVNSGSITNGAEFFEASIIGIFDAGCHFHDCEMRNTSVDMATFHDCLLEEFTTTLTGSGTTHWINCASAVPGNNTPIIDFNGLPAEIGIRNYNGGITLQNKTGTQPISIDMNSGHVILDSSITNGLILIRGVGKITDNSAGATVDVTHYLSPLSIADQVWDEQNIDHLDTGSMGEALNSASAGGGASAAEIADAVWDEAAADHVAVGSMGEALKGVFDLDYQVVSSGDDVRFRTNTIVTNDVAFILGDDGVNINSSAARFLGIDIPKGATIISSFLTFTPDTPDTTNATHATLQIEASDNPAQITTTAEWNTRVLSVEPLIVPWPSMTPDWTAEVEEQSPDITVLIQQVVNRPGWVRGNAINIFWLDNVSEAGANKIAHSYDSDPTKALKINIVYSLVTDVNLVSDAVWNEPAIDHLNVGTTGETLYKGAFSVDVRVSASLDDTFLLDNTHTFLPTQTSFSAGRSTSNIFESTARFLDIQIPNGSTIDVAYLVLQVRTENPADRIVVNTDLFVEDADNATQIADDSDYHSRTLTSAITWDNIPPWDTLDVLKNSASIVSSIQTVIDRAGWSAGNSIQVFWKDGGSSSIPTGVTRDSHSYDSDPEKAPILHIEFTPPATSKELIADAVWEEQISDHLGSGTTGEKLDGADATADVAAIADAVWEEPRLDHLDRTTMGGALDDASSSEQEILIIQTEHDAHAASATWQTGQMILGDSGASNPDRRVYLRFEDIRIPQGAFIKSCSLTVVSNADRSNTDVLTDIFFEDEDDPTVVIDAADYDSRALTTTLPYNNIPAWGPSEVITAIPDLSSILQEVIDRPGWIPGNALNLLWKNNGSTSGAQRSISDFSTFPTPDRVSKLKITFGPKFQINAPATGVPSAELIADTVWDELHDDHIAAGTMGYMQNLIDGLNGTIDLQPSAGGFDGTGIPGVSWNSALLAVTFGNDSGVADNVATMRYPLDIPQGATILAAEMQFGAFNQNTNQTCNARIQVENVGNATVITDLSEFDAAFANLSTAFTDWAVPGWSSGTEGPSQLSPDFTSVIQEIIDRGDWVSGNEINIFFADNGSTANARRQANAFEDIDGGPKLHIEWIVPLLDTEQIADAVWEEQTADHLTSGTTGEKLDSGSPVDNAAIADAVWEEQTADHLASGTTGEKLDGADATADVAAIAIAAADAVWDEDLSEHLASGTTGEKLDSGSPVDNAAIADAVWEEQTADHLASGTTGEKLDADTPVDNAAIADAVWDETISEHTDVGSTGEALDNVSAGASPSTIAAAVWDETIDQSTHASADTAGDIMLQAQKNRKMSTNKASITVDGNGVSTITIFDDDGVTPIHVHTVQEDLLDRTPVP